MLRTKLAFIVPAVLVSAAVCAPASAQTQETPRTAEKAQAYYHYALGHVYAELAGAYGNRGDYLSKAIDNYKLAMKEDPGASFLSEELSDLYIQAGRIREAVADAEEALKQNPNDVAAHRLLGRIYTRMIGDPQQGRIDEKMLPKAIEQYKKVAELAPNDVDTWVMLGRLQKFAQSSVESEKAYKKALELDPNNEDALTGLAMVYADVGDNKNAAEMLRRVSEKNPSMRSLTALATAYEQMRDYTLAAETMRRALDLQPGNNEVKRAYAQDLLLAEQLDEALKQYKEILLEEPKDAGSWLRLSQIYREKGDFDNATSASQKAQQIDPNNLEIRYNDVMLLEAEGKSDQAITTLSEILKSTAKKTYTTPEKNNRVVLLERLGILYRSNEKYEEAVVAFREIPDVDPDLGARSEAQVIDTYRLGKKYDKALAEADKATAQYPDDRVIRAVKASTLAEVGKSDQAVTELKKLLDGKSDRETYISLAQVYEKSKNYTEMAKALDAADKLSSTNDEKESIAFMRGAMYEKMKDYPAAEAAFQKVLELNPKNSSALNYLGYMLADRDTRLPEAQAMISKAVALEPNNGAYLDSLGWVYYRMGKLDEAETYLRRALEKFSKDPTIHDHLGDVYAKQGKLKEAIVHWQNSLNEWDNSAPSERDPAEVARIQKKLESARVRLARETGVSAKQ
jgi:tetratricopeptide (TPR) repeat protein